MFSLGPQRTSGVGLCQETDRSRPAALRPKSRSPPPYTVRGASACPPMRPGESPRSGGSQRCRWLWSAAQGARASASYMREHPASPTV